MSEEIIKSLFTLLAGALTVWGTLQVSKRSDKAQRRKEEAEAHEAEQTRIKSIEDSLWERMESKLQEQDDRITKLTNRLNDSEAERHQQATQIRELQDRERDREELLADYRTNTLAWELYVQSGSVPPPPVYSWRVRADLEQIRKEVEP